MMLKILYETKAGRCFLKLLTWPLLSRIAGKFLDSPYSRFLIPFFVRGNHIDLSICQDTNFTSFNDCFCRKIKEVHRPVAMQPSAFISPCDGLLTVYPIHKDLVIPVKQSQYRISDLLRDASLAENFEDGYCMVFRLCVDHYHRYCFIDQGSQEDAVFLPGILHTVRPIALRNLSVFTENAREYTLLHTDHFGDLIQMEVGAMFVGRISNHPGKKSFKKGEEKGNFLYGGSTIILLTQKDQIELPEFLWKRSAKGLETPVKYGQQIGKKKKDKKNP